LILLVEKKKQDDKLNEYLEQIKKYEEKENEFNKLSEVIIKHFK